LARDGWNELDLETLEVELEDEVSVETSTDAEEIDTSTSTSVDDGAEDTKKRGKPSRAELRIKQITREKHEWRELAESLGQTVNALKGEVGNIKKGQRDYETATVAGLKRTVTEELAVAEEAWASATDEGDSKGALAHMRKMRDLEDKKRRLDSYVPPQEERQQQPQRQQPRANPKVAQWLQAHPIVMQDANVREATAEYAAELEAEGYSPNDPDYYTEVEKKLAEEFPEHFKQKTRPRSTVAGKTRSGGGGKNTIRLSKEEQDIARKFGLSNKEYAVQKAKAEANSTKENSGYVLIN